MSSSTRTNWRQQTPWSSGAFQMEKNPSPGTATGESLRVPVQESRESHGAKSIKISICCKMQHLMLTNFMSITPWMLIPALGLKILWRRQINKHEYEFMGVHGYVEASLLYIHIVLNFISMI